MEIRNDNAFDIRSSLTYCIYQNRRINSHSNYIHNSSICNGFGLCHGLNTAAVNQYFSASVKNRSH